MSETTLWHLKNFKFFNNISEEEIMNVTEDAPMTTFNKGDIIYSEGDIVDRIYIIKTGEVLLSHNRNGKMQIFSTLGPGDIFGGLSLEKEKSLHLVEVGLGARICHFPQSAFFKVLYNNPKAFSSFINEVSNRMNEYEDRLGNANEPAQNILLKELEHLNTIRGRSFFGFIKRPLIITHNELAKRTGLNRVTITKEMNRLIESGKIKIDKSTGVIEIM